MGADIELNRNDKCAGKRLEQSLDDINHLFVDHSLVLDEDECRTRQGDPQ